MNIHKEYLKNKKERKKLVLILVLMITLFLVFYADNLQQKRFTRKVKSKAVIRRMAAYIGVSYTALVIRLRDMGLFEYHNILEYISKHFMDIMNGSYAQTHFPCKLWDAGEKGLTLSAFEWEKDRKTLIYGQVDYMYGEALYKPEMKEGNPIRLYSLDEITEIFGKLGLRICNSFADFSGKPSSDNDIQLMVYSIRE